MLSGRHLWRHPHCHCRPDTRHQNSPKVSSSPAWRTLYLLRLLYIHPQVVACKWSPHARLGRDRSDRPGTLLQLHHIFRARMCHMSWHHQPHVRFCLECTACKRQVGLQRCDTSPAGTRRSGRRKCLHYISRKLYCPAQVRGYRAGSPDRLSTPGSR